MGDRRSNLGSFDAELEKLNSISIEKLNILFRIGLGAQASKQTKIKLNSAQRNHQKPQVTTKRQTTNMIERRPRVCRNAKLAASGKPERNTPLSLFQQTALMKYDPISASASFVSEPKLCQAAGLDIAYRKDKN
nr:hypothetical protein Iba_chr06bCG1510 [Ipomoea batatas]GMD08940.1 hypothetical protein Iba_chr06dCG3360 [Ipomoea batatas]